MRESVLRPRPMPKTGGKWVVALLVTLPPFVAAVGSAERVVCGPAVLADGAAATTFDEASLQRLALPTGLPSAFDVPVRLEGGWHVLRLQKRSLRAPGFRVRAYGEGGAVEIEPPPPATYRGVVDGLPGALVAAALRPEGMSARVYLDGGSGFVIRTIPGEDRTRGPVLQHVGTEGCAEPAAGARVPVDAPEPRPIAGKVGSRGSTDGHAGQHLTEIAFDASFPFYQLQGSSVPATTAEIESRLNETEAFFARDVFVTFTITDIIVRTAPFYDHTGDFFQQFIDEWVANQGPVVRDVAHLVTETGVAQGQARVGTVCDPNNGYSYSTVSASIMAHEIAHNFDTDHCHGWVPCDTMCGACMSFTVETQAVVDAFLPTLACLDDVGPYTDPLAPYAGRDAAYLTREDIVAGAPIPIDVLANDRDGNFDTVTLDAFDATSEKGAGISQSGSDLHYTPPPVFPGDDFLEYTAGDGTGLQSTAGVDVQVEAPGLAGYWNLDEGSGTTAGDGSGGERHAAITGATWAGGVYGNALQFAAPGDEVVAPAPRRNSTAGTITAWVQRSGAQPTFAGIVSVSGLKRSGLNFGTANELRYQWNDDPAASGFDSGLVVPDGQWVLVAVAVEPTQATLYLHDGTTLQSSVNAIAHEVQDWNGNLRFGRDTQDPARQYSGLLDDVRVYDYALSAAELQALHDQGGRAHGPHPPNGHGMLRGQRELSWSPGLAALSHDVYFGTDYVAVRDATAASPEFRGNQVATTFTPPGPLQPGATYAWRVDEVTASGTVMGHVWLFAPGSLLHHWKLDETSGTNAADSAGGLDGTYLGSPLQGQPSPQPELQTAVRFDALDDSVEIPALNLKRNDVTFTFWMRRAGLQADQAGIIVSRSPDTLFGFNMLQFGLLQFKYRDVNVPTQEWTATSGFFIPPDNQWVFLAMSIQPDRWSIYYQQGASLTRETLFQPTDREEFDGLLYLGQDPIGGRFFRGEIDDVRVYDFGLTTAQVEEVFAQGIAAGRVPDGGGVPGGQLTLDKAAAGDISLDWSASCSAADTDYAVYAGTVGDFSDHLPALCSTGGATSATLTPKTGDRYYLVVPTSANREGEYGDDGAGQPRPQSSAACFTQYLAVCD